MSEIGPPEGDIVELIPPGHRDTTALSTETKTQYERLCPYAESIGALQLNDDGSIQYYRLTYQLEGPAKTLMYEVPITSIHAGQSMVDRTRPSTIDVFFDQHKYDHTIYTFNLELIIDRKLKQQQFRTYTEQPNVVRMCNIALGAHFANEKLIELGYILDQIDDTHWTYKYPNEEKEEREEGKEGKEGKEETEITDEEKTDLIIDNLAEYYVKEVAGSSGIKSAYQSKYSDPVTPEELDQIVQNNSQMEKIKRNLTKYLSWKRQQYVDRLKNLQKGIDHEKKVFSQAGLSEDEKKTLSTALPGKLATAYLKGAIECIDAKIPEIENMSIEEIRQSYEEALKLIRDINNEEIQNQLSGLISSLVGGYQGFSADFQNIVITGPAGVGKTTLAVTLSRIFQLLQILCLGIIQIVTRTELVAAFVGQTAGKTRTALFSSLEGVLFIDEAYQVGGCPKEDQYGMESLTELVNFLDKYIGISVIIVAGYEKEMEECFFDRNEGLKRRFPNKFKLTEYDSATLLKVLLSSIYKNFPYDLFSNDLDEVKFLYRAIQKFEQEGLFPNMGGDMQILAGKILRYYLATQQIHSSILRALYEFCDQTQSSEVCDNFLSLLEG